MARRARPSGSPRRVFHGRRQGRRLKPGQRAALEEGLARFALPGVDAAGNPGRAPLDLSWLAGRPLWLEIGFGGGEHLARLAALDPGTAFVGCEPFVNGVATLFRHVAEAGLENVRVHPGDARDLLDVLPEGSVARCFLLYPDPWPKKRHHRRRAVTPEYLLPLRRAMAPGAELRVATDVPDYVRQALEEAPRAGFEWLAEDARSWREPWDGWVPTRYERKALREGRTPCYLAFRRA